MKILYVGNTSDRNVRAYGLNRKGEATNERVIISDLPGGPDGIRTDAKGNLYSRRERSPCACPFPDRFSTESTARLHTVISVCCIFRSANRSRVQSTENLAHLLPHA